MFKRWTVTWCLLVIASGLAEAHYTSPPTTQSRWDYAEHAWGNHNWAVTFSGGCQYYGTDPNVPCTISGFVSANTSDGDAGRSSLKNPLYVHSYAAVVRQGGGASNGPTLNLMGDAAFSVRSCLANCAVNIGVSGSVLTGGFSFTFPPDQI